MAHTVKWSELEERCGPITLISEERYPKLAGLDPRRVVTIVDGEREPHALPGIHFVDRLDYLLLAAPMPPSWLALDEFEDWGYPS